MKKLIRKFVKPINRKTKCYSFYISDVPQSDNRTSNIISSPTNIYKNFQFDSNHCNNNDDCYLSLEKTRECKKESENSSQHRAANDLNDEFVGESVMKAKGSWCSTESSMEKDFLGGDNERNDFELSEGNRKNTKSNTYVISISNSKNFCIGSQKTVYVNDIKKPQEIQNGAEGAVNHWEPLLNCDKKLTEEDIYLISQHVDNRWKDFLQSLGVEESLIENTTFRNNSNKTLVTYDLLMKYLSDFPNTSLGFVAKVLKNTNQNNAITNLAKIF